MTKKQLLISLGLIIFTAAGGIIFGFFWGKQKDQAQFYFAAHGSNATVYLNQKNLGSAPIKAYRLQSGLYELTVETDYYRYTTPLQFTPGTASIVDWYGSDSLEKSGGIIYELIPQAQKEPNLQINSFPERAIINFPGDSTPLFTPVKNYSLKHTDLHEFTITLPGYKSLSIPFTLSPYYTLKITAKLARDF